jgi:CubicO group peptidase (beta-lactamase class C family)
MPFKKLLHLFFLILLILNLRSFGQVKDPLPRSNPEAEGVASGDIKHFLDAVSRSKNEFHSLMILRHGKVIAEGWWNPYRSDLRHTMYSTSKSFTSTAVGFAVSEGKIKLSDKVISYFPDDLPDTVSPALAALTLKDLITMSVGQKPDPTFRTMQKENWAKYFLSLPILDTAGKVFLYNSVAPYMLSAIVQKVTGEKIIDYLRPRLFQPLGIEGMDWETSPQGVNSGGWGLRVKTEDMAKFGELYLQKGIWNGKQVLSKSWIEEATSFKIDQAPKMAKASRDSNDWAQGYCYQFWRCRHNAFRADGAFGQYVIVMPDQDAVIIITGETPDMQDELNLVWTYLLPAFKPGSLPADAAALASLKQQLSSLALASGTMTKDPPIAGNISGKSFKLDSNELKADEVRFSFQDNSCTMSLKEGDSIYSFTSGSGKWNLGETHIPSAPPSLIKASVGPFADLGPAKIASSYTWKDDHTMLFTVRYIESPHTEIMICSFTNNTVAIELDGSIKRMAHSKNNKVLKGILQ